MAGRAIMRLALCLALHLTRAAWLAPPASRVAWRASEPRADVSTAPLSLFPAWPASTERQLTPTLEAYEALVDVPLRASGGDGWREWSEAGCAANKLVASKLSRNTYLEVLQTLFAVLVGSQQRYPDLWAVLKFVPKKNGLNPLLQRVSEGDLEALSLEGQRAREVRRRLDDLQRAFEQTWLLLCAYLTLPSSELREDAMWAARTLVEKVKTDQRSRALELLCLGVYYRGSALFGLVSHGRSAWTLRAGFEDNFGGDAWHPKPTNARMIWQRCRMVYPLLEVAHRAWLRASGRWDGARGPTRDDGAAIAVLLDSIARAGPEEKVINSLLYWLLDLSYKSMLDGERIPKWAPEPFILVRPGVEERMAGEFAAHGHLLQLLTRCPSHVSPEKRALPEELLEWVKEVEATATLLASIRSSCGDLCPDVLAAYEEGLASPDFTLERLEALEFDAMGAMLGLDGALVASRADAVRRAMSEWRNPELLFRYLDANRHDAKMEALIIRWLRAIFGLSPESLRMIRRESPENVRHLLRIPQDVLLRWYAGDCPGTSKCKALFMLGEDAGSCLRIISNEGNKYNRALMGYVLQSHVRALVLTDTVGRTMVRSLIRLVVRSDTHTPVIFCDPIFFTLGYRPELQQAMVMQARELEAHMGVPVVHAGSVLPVLEGGEIASRCVVLEGDEAELGAARPANADEGYARRVRKLDYDVIWVELLETDGVAPYTYSEELPYDEFLQQHAPGVQTRTDERPELVVATLPRADSPSAERYAAERDGETAWTMRSDDDAPRPELPLEIKAQLEERTHTNRHTFDPDARFDESAMVSLPPNYRPPSLDE